MAEAAARAGAAPTRSAGSESSAGRGSPVATAPGRPLQADAAPAPPRGPAGGWWSPRGRERLLQLGFLVPAVVYLLLFFGYPVVQNALMGFQEYTTRTFYTGEAPWVGFDNYVAVLSAGVFGTALLNTVLFTVGSIAGQFVIGLAIALFFQRRFPLSGFAALAAAAAVADPADRVRGGVALDPRPGQRRAQPLPRRGWASPTTPAGSPARRSP